MAATEGVARPQAKSKSSMPWIARGWRPKTSERVSASKGLYHGRDECGATLSNETIWSWAAAREPSGLICWADDSLRVASGVSAPPAAAAFLLRSDDGSGVGDVFLAIPSASGTISVMCVSGP